MYILDIPVRFDKCLPQKYQVLVTQNNIYLFLKLQIVVNNLAFELELKNFLHDYNFG